jgi:hypothetical protein
MDARWRLRIIAILMLASVAGIGCNPFNLAYFLTGGPESKIDPEYRIADRDREVTVLILAYSTADVQTDQLGIDRQLGTNVARQLADRCRVNKERVNVVPIHRVEKFKSDNPGWKSMGAAEIGRHFAADYVVDVEVAKFSLYEPGSRRALYRGNSMMNIVLLDVHKPLDGPVLKRSISVEYPKSRGPQPVDQDSNPDRFRDQFVTRISSEICWLFTTHPFSEECQCD